MSAQSRMTKSRVTVQMQVDQIIQVNPTGHISVGWRDVDFSFADIRPENMYTDIIRDRQKPAKKHRRSTCGVNRQEHRKKRVTLVDCWR